MGEELARVSAIIPCFNQAYFLSEAIESVLAQSYPFVEILVVDDGSTDNTQEVAARYPVVRCVQQENRGLAAARNRGAECSDGQYLVFLDADDRLLPCAIERGVACLQANPSWAFVYGRYQLIAADGSPLPPWRKCPIDRDPYIALLRRNFIEMHAAVVYRRSVFEAVGGFDSSLRACEDYEFYLRIARSFSIGSHDAVVAEYRQHSANMTRSQLLMLCSALTALESQRVYVAGNPRREVAYQTGRVFWQAYYGRQLVRAMFHRCTWFERKQALVGLLTLVRLFPILLVDACQLLSIYGSARLHSGE